MECTKIIVWRCIEAESDLFGAGKPCRNIAQHFEDMWYSLESHTVSNEI